MIVVFDSQCLLCSRSVRFLLRFDRDAVFRFASMQGEAGRALAERAGLSPDDPRSFLLVDADRVRVESDAVIAVLEALGWPWRAAASMRVVPAPWRDAAYRLIARHRVTLFGRSDACLVPSPQHAPRFLD